MPQHEFIASREFPITREAMWDLWTDPKEMAKWWGPKGATIKASKMDLRPNGMYLYGMEMPDGKEMWGKFVYREIHRPDKIVLINSFSNAEGGVTRHPLAPNWPLQMVSTFTFMQNENGTEVGVKWSPFNPTEIEMQTFDEGMESMKGGWAGTFDKLDEFIEGNNK